jgi:cell fate regulator YaaT (PSP1 superfamily)
MKKIVKVRFKPTGKVYDFDSGAFVLKCGDRVIVETDHGLGLGTVVVPPKPFDEQQYDRLLKKVSRLVNEKDLCQWEKNCDVENSA